jgi:hypothetical protein
MRLNPAGFTEGLISGLNGIADWIANNRTAIYGFFVSVREKILAVWGALKNRDFEGFLKAIGLDETTIGKITAFKDGVVVAFETISGWVDENGPLIEEFFGSLGEIIGGVFKNLAPEDSEGGLEGLLDGVQTFMTFVIEHQEGIATFVTVLIQLWGILQVIGLAFSIILPPIMAVLGFIISLAAGVAFLGAAWNALVAIVAVITGILAGITVPILALIFLVAVLAAAIIENWDYIVIAFEFLKDYVVKWFTEMKSNFLIGADALGQTFLQMWDDLVKIGSDQLDRMKKLGSAIIDGIAKGISEAAQSVIAAVSGVVTDAYKASMDAIGAIRRPSCTRISESFRCWAWLKASSMRGGTGCNDECRGRCGDAPMNMSMGAAALGSGE